MDARRQQAAQGGRHRRLCAPVAAAAEQPFSAASMPVQHPAHDMPTGMQAAWGLNSLIVCALIDLQVT
jgi:hypothetical protein